MKCIWGSSSKMTCSAVVLSVGGAPVTAGQVIKRLENILTFEIPESNFKFKKPVHRFGMVGGMGPVAGAELAVEVNKQLVEKRKLKILKANSPQ